MNEFINGREVPHYTSHKQVQALEIAKLDGEATMGATVHFVFEAFGSLYCEAAMFARYVPVPGDYLVFYPDGYKSFSPRRAFRDGYEAR